jgi:hypothetical protein
LPKIEQARVWFGATAAIVAAGLVIQLLVVATASHSRWGSIPARLFNVLCYFTIESNLIVGVTCLLLAMRLDRPSAAFRVFRLIGLVGILITGIVYHVAIAKLVEFDGWALVADQLTHTVVPVMAVVGWFMYGPRGQTSWPVIRLVLLYPIAYISFTLVRGRIVDFYPYHFIDVASLGYGKVAANGAWIALLFVAAAAGYHGGSTAGSAATRASYVRIRAATWGVQPRSSISTA